MSRRHAQPAARSSQPGTRGSVRGLAAPVRRPVSPSLGWVSPASGPAAVRAAAPRSRMPATSVAFISTCNQLPWAHACLPRTAPRAVRLVAAWPRDDHPPGHRGGGGVRLAGDDRRVRGARRRPGRHAAELGAADGGGRRRGAARPARPAGARGPGPGRLQLAAVGEVSALDEAQTRSLRGPRADPAAFLVIRPYLRRAVYVAVARPGAESRRGHRRLRLRGFRPRVEMVNPVVDSPYWLVSTRHP